MVSCVGDRTRQRSRRRRRRRWDGFFAWLVQRRRRRCGRAVNKVVYLSTCQPTGRSICSVLLFNRIGRDNHRSAEVYGQRRTRADAIFACVIFLSDECVEVNMSQTKSLYI